MNEMQGFYSSHSWGENPHKYVNVGQDSDDPDDLRFDPRYPVYQDSGSRRQSSGVFRFLDLPKDIRLLIYELIVGCRIIHLSWYDSVYNWNEGRRFFYSAPRVDAGLIEPQNHLRLLWGFQQPVEQFAGFPPHQRCPLLPVRLLMTCRQIYEEAKEIPFKRNILVALGAQPYAAFRNKILLPLQTSSIRFLTIVINTRFDSGPNLRLWYDERVQPLPNLTSVLFITRVRVNDWEFDFDDPAGPIWWSSLWGASPISAEHVHKVPNVFRLLAHSKSGTQYGVSVDDGEVKDFIRSENTGKLGSRAETYDTENAAQLDEEGYAPRSPERFERCVLGYFSLRESDKNIYIDGFRRRLDEVPTRSDGKPDYHGSDDSDSDSGSGSEEEQGP